MVFQANILQGYPALVLFSILGALLLWLSHLVNREDKGYSWYTKLMFTLRRPRLPRIVHDKFISKIDSALKEFEVSASTAMGKNVYRELDLLRLRVESPLRDFHYAADEVWDKYGWAGYKPHRTHRIDAHLHGALDPRERSKLNERYRWRQSPAKWYGRECASRECRSNDHQTCRLGLDELFDSEKFVSQRESVLGRITKLRAEWEAWEKDQISFDQITQLIEASSGHQPLIRAPKDVVILPYVLNTSVLKTIQECTMAQRVIYRHTMLSGAILAALGEEPGQRFGFHDGLLMGSRTVLSHAYENNQHIDLDMSQAVDTEGLDMEMFMMVLSRAHPAQGLRKTAAAARALTRAELSRVSVQNSIL